MRINKAVLISIRPEWCEKIISGEKTIEVRKNYPDRKPIKCYIYCTIGKKTLYRSSHDGTIRLYHKAEPESFSHHQVLNGKVIGEFVCDKVFNIFEFSGSRFWLNEALVRDTCLTDDKIRVYAGGANEVYGWHISGLKIYDRPRDARDFHCFGHIFPINRPPQSWCYVEDIV